MKKLILSFSVIITYTFYVIFSQRFATTNQPLPAQQISADIPTSGVTPVSQPVSPTPTAPAPKTEPPPKPVSTPAPVATPRKTPSNPSSPYNDGTYTGKSADAYYGNIQVKVTIQGGKITNVTFLDYPQDRSRSVFINTQAMPLLKQEAISAQSANVDGVSGATDTSMAFVQSLSSALAIAKK